MRSATNLAVTGLIRKKLVELRSVEFSNDYPQDRFFATERGEDWLIANQQKLNLRLPTAAVSGPDPNDYAHSTEITDDDIPF